MATHRTCDLGGVRACGRVGVEDVAVVNRRAHHLDHDAPLRHPTAIAPWPRNRLGEDALQFLAEAHWATVLRVHVDTGVETEGARFLATGGDEDERDRVALD